ncbi:hypothetical protein VTK73DRAFT_4242 [Phialemonium thermophilum]|uniref:Uncharacterized protein n=1 Tax=Phialemonium thermophilum TaxID=223376 RepID=A0ABR3VAL6_9PEZI
MRTERWAGAGCAGSTRCAGIPAGRRSPDGGVLAGLAAVVPVLDGPDVAPVVPQEVAARGRGGGAGRLAGDDVGGARVRAQGAEVEEAVLLEEAHVGPVGAVAAAARVVGQGGGSGGKREEGRGRCDE